MFRRPVFSNRRAVVQAGPRTVGRTSSVDVPIGTKDRHFVGGICRRAPDGSRQARKRNGCSPLLIGGVQCASFTTMETSPSRPYASLRYAETEVTVCVGGAFSVSVAMTIDALNEQGRQICMRSRSRTPRRLLQCRLMWRRRVETNNTQVGQRLGRNWPPASSCRLSAAVVGADRSLPDSIEV